MAPYLGLKGSSLRAAIALAAGLCFVAFGYGQSDFGGLLTCLLYTSDAADEL